MFIKNILLTADFKISLSWFIFTVVDKRMCKARFNHFDLSNLKTSNYEFNDFC